MRIENFFANPTVKKTSRVKAWKNRRKNNLQKRRKKDKKEQVLQHV